MRRSTTNTRPSGFAAAAHAALLAALLGTGCGRSVVAAKPQLRAANLTADTALRVQVDGVQLFGPLASGTSSIYRPIDPGKRQLTLLFDGGVQSKISPTLQDPYGYSVLAVDGAQKPIAIVTRDVSIAPTGRIRARVAHLSPELASVDIYVDRVGGAPVALDASFGQVSAYQLIQPDSTQLVVAEPGGSTAIATIDLGPLKYQTAYTIALLSPGTGANRSPRIDARALDDSGLGNGRALSLAITARAGAPLVVPAEVLAR